MLTRLFTTALLMTSLPEIFGRPEALPAMSNDICQQFSPTLASFDLYHAPERAITPLVTQAMVAETITGLTQNECHHVAKAVMEIREIHPNITDYVDFVFTHSPTLRISKFTEEYLKQSDISLNALGIYSAREIQLTIRDTEINDINIKKINNFLIHELRHAAMNTAHRILKSASALSSEVYYPKVKKEKILNMLDYGKIRVENLKKLLRRETKPSKQNPLNEHEKNRLEKLRKESLLIYEQHYRLEFETTINEADFKAISKKEKVKIQLGNTYNIDYYYDTFFGAFELVEIQKRLDENNVSVLDILILMNDPLYAFVTQIEDIESFIHDPEMYSEEEIISEFDAFLSGNIPQFLIAEFYPEFYAASNSLIKMARSISVPYKNKAAHEFKSIDVDIRFKNEIMDEMQRPDYFISIHALYYLHIASEAAANGDYELAKIAMPTLINNNLLVYEAQKLLDLIADAENSNKRTLR